VAEAERNRYEPPKADVGIEVVEPLPTLPRPVNAAIVLILLVVLYEITDALIFWQSYEFPRAIATYLSFLAIRLAVMTACLIGIARAHNWARLVFLLPAALAVNSAGFTFYRIVEFSGGMALLRHPWTTLLITLPPAAMLTAIYLLFVPGRGWFATRAV
jgi:hypothetical protein